MSLMESRLRPRRGKKAVTAKSRSQESSAKASATFVDDEQDQGLEIRTGPEDATCDSEDESETRKVKRAKTSKASRLATRGKKKGQASRRGKKCLSLIFTMPMDVLYEILSMLSPKDVLSLYQTNKQFNELLASPQATFVWKRARETDGCPDPTPDMSEPDWAFLIYGSNRCDECSSPNIQMVDFWLRRRVCASCRKAMLVEEWEFEESFPSINQDVLKLIPYTTLGGCDQGRPSQRCYYLIGDIWDTAKVWTELGKAVKKGEPGAQAKLEEYEETRIHLVTTITNKAMSAFEWHSKRLQARAQSKRDAAFSRRESIYKRFEEMGYLREDIEFAIEYTPEVEQKRELTERIWQRIHPILEEKIRAYIRDRILRYMQGLPPNKWVDYPEPTTLFLRPELECLLEEEGDVEEVVKSKWQTDVLPRLPQVSERWIKEKKTELRKLVLPDSIPSKAQIEPLDLAVAVFGCDTGYCNCFAGDDLSRVTVYTSVQLYGWDEARFHLHLHHLNLFEKAQKVVKTLLREVRLDPLKTTVDLMDNGAHLFYCEVCISREPEDIMGVYSWREAVNHSLEHCRYASTEAKWKALPSEYHKLVVVDSDYLNKSCWSCNHCGANTRCREPLNSVKSHLTTKHQISQPKEGVDLILFPSDLQRLSRRYYEGPCERFRTK